MLAKLAYLPLCRSIQQRTLLARGDAAKDLEILVLRHQLAVLRRCRAGIGGWSLVPGPPRHRQPGRPPLDQQLQPLIIRLAREHPRWSDQRIQGELLRLGRRASATAVRTTLRRHGLDPTPRPTTTTWRAFRRQQAAGIVAGDCFTVDTVWLQQR